MESHESQDHSSVVNPELLRISPAAVEFGSPWEICRRAQDSILWRSRREGTIWTGVGCAYETQSLNECLDVLSGLDAGESPFPPRCFGSIAFDPSQTMSGIWAGFSKRRFWIPRKLIRWGEGRPQAVRIGNDSEDQLPEPSLEHAEVPGILSRGNWNRAVEEIQSAIRKSKLRKVVLARQVHLSLAGEFDLGRALPRAHGNSPESFVFGYRQAGSSYFFGASPECLFHRSGSRLSVDSLAGTRPRGGNPVQDNTLRNELLTSNKDFTEQNLVTQFISEKLLRLCTHSQVDPAAAVHQFETVQHLYSTVRGALRPGITSEAILDALHPTPAVCGVPREHARELIHQLEPAPRGLYAGAIGWADADEAEFAVAIRCGLVQGNQAALFAGAGIIEGSDAGREYEECEWKMQGIRKLLNSST